MDSLCPIPIVPISQLGLTNQKWRPTIPTHQLLVQFHPQKFDPPFHEDGDDPMKKGHEAKIEKRREVPRELAEGEGGRKKDRKMASQFGSGLGLVPGDNRKEVSDRGGAIGGGERVGCGPSLIANDDKEDDGVSAIMEMIAKAVADEYNREPGGIEKHISRRSETSLENMVIEKMKDGF